MDGLFVNTPNTNAQVKRISKVNSSNYMKIRRYNEIFYKHNLMEMYTWINFLAIKYHFDIKSLLELLLESLYDETKIDAFVYQMSRTEEKEESPGFYYVVLRIILQRYMDSKDISQEIKTSAVRDLLILMDINAGMLVVNHPVWSLEFLNIRSNQVKFYKEEKIKAKLEKILNGSFFTRPCGEVFIDFLNYMEAKQFLHDSETNKQIEEILSRYYYIYLKKRQSHSVSKDC